MTDVDALTGFERLVGVLASVVTILAALTGVAAWITHRRSTPTVADVTGAGSPELVDLTGPTVFAASARVEGAAESFVDRRRPVRRLSAEVRGRASVVSIEGLPGVGKTALAAALCVRLGRRRRVGRPAHRICWVYCGERSDLSLSRLSTGLAGLGLAGAGSVWSALRPPGTTIDVIDAVIGYLHRHRILLVLDDYHRLRDGDVAELVDKLRRSRIRSTLVLTSRRHPEAPTTSRLTASLVVPGLPRRAARAFLRGAGLTGSAGELDAIWAKAGFGVPKAMQLLVGHAMGRPIADVLRSLPAYEANLTQWMASLHAELDPTVRELAEIVAFAYEPVTRGLLASVLDDATRLEAGLAELVARLILSEIEPGVYEMHPLWRDHLGRLLDPDRKLRYGSRMAGHYQRRARDLLRGVGEEPSYGALYLESFPEYVNDGARHGRLVDDVMGCLRSTGLQPEPGARVLVLGAGHGTHDPGLARYDLDLVNVELLPDMAVRAMARARTLPTPIGYVVADMTRPLPFRENSFDAIVNLGSSFGYEDADADNAAMFRHAARVLRQGRPLVFEYANGGYWQRYEREIGVTTLPDGGIRTNYKVVDPQRRTSLNIISLRRPGQAPRYLHHFMHYYRLDEIVAMMADAGLEPVASYGVTAEGRVSGPFQPTHSAMVVIAVRR